MSLFFYPYKNGSKSVKALKDLLGAKEIKLEGSRFRLTARKTVINWGSSSCPYPCLNTAESVGRAANKLEAFKAFEEYVTTPNWTESREEASQWLVDGVAKMIVCRTVLNGHSGAGIVLAKAPEEIVEAPLYVQYMPKKEEYRVHVFEREAFFVQRKARRLEEEAPNWQIRNHQNGFIFANQDIVLPDEAKELAVKAIEILGLDFGAVDIIWNEKNDIYYVLEVNTAPGLEGVTLQAYREKMEEK